MNKKYYVTEAELDENKRLVILDEPGVATREELELEAEYLSGKLLKIEGTVKRTYDNSDDDRVEDSSHSYDIVRYGEIDVFEDSQFLLRIDGEIKGVVFVVEDGGYNDYYAFSYDGKIHQTMMLGYSASHSSEYTYIEKVTLVRKGEKGAPQEARRVRFKQNPKFPSF